MSKTIQIEFLGGDLYRCLIGGPPVGFRGNRAGAERLFRALIAQADGRGLLRYDHAALSRVEAPRSRQ
jgi:hypothetical protein